MQPRTLEQIINELNTNAYANQIETLRKQQELIPQNVQSSIEKAGAAQTQAYENIVTGARRRGIGFSGIPLGEQAKYASTVYAPAVLAAQEAGRTQALSLEDAVNRLVSERAARAEQIRQYELNFAEQQRQFNENKAIQRAQLAATQAANATTADYYKWLASQGQGGGAGSNAAKYSYTWDNKAGYQFKDASGKPVSALEYYKASGGQPSAFKDWLSALNQAHGDSNMSVALSVLGNNYNVVNAPENMRSQLAQLGITEGTWVNNDRFKKNGQSTAKQDWYNKQQVWKNEQDWLTKTGALLPLSAEATWLALTGQW